MFLVSLAQCLGWPCMHSPIPDVDEESSDSIKTHSHPPFPTPHPHQNTFPPPNPQALVHSRIRRVFYAIANPHCGALASRWQLHTQPTINHHYEVYRGLCARVCRERLPQPTSPTP
jgi:hypothetical protein